MLDLLLPQRCLGCSRNGPQVCAACAGGLRRIRSPLCTRCGRPTAWPVARCGECEGRRLAFAAARAAVVYDDPVRRIVTAWKERGLRRLAPWAAELVVEVVPRPLTGVLTFVPADEDRRLRRGHHSAQALATELARLWELPVERLLGRTRPARRQRGLDEHARRRNVRGAFAGSAVVPRTIVLVDDVYTTGATANSAASALRRAGARRVEVVTFARAIRRR